MQIAISVSGGVVQDLYCSDTDADIWLVDWDAEAGEPDAESALDFELSGHPLRAIVARPNPQPLRALAGSEIEAAIEAAEMQLCSGQP